MSESKTYLFNLLSNKLSIKADELTNSADLFDLGLDSFGFIEIVGEIEKKYNIVFSEDDLMDSNFNTLDGITLMIQNKL